MLVRVTCTCKKSWFVDDSLAGSAVGCKSCEASVIVPGEVSHDPDADPQAVPQAVPQASVPAHAAPHPSAPTPPVPPPAGASEFILAYDYAPPLGSEKKLYGVYRQSDALLFLRLGPLIDGMDLGGLAREGANAAAASTGNPAAAREEPKLRARLSALAAMTARERLLEATNAPNILATTRNMTQVRLEACEGFPGPWATSAEGQTRAYLKLRVGNRNVSLEIRDPGDLRQTVRWLWEMLGPDAVLVSYLMEPPLPSLSSQQAPVKALVHRAAMPPPPAVSEPWPGGIPPKPAGRSGPNKLQAWGGAVASVVVFGALALGRSGCTTGPAIQPPAYVAASAFPELGNPTPMRLESAVLPAAIQSPVAEARFNEVILRRGDRTTRLWVYRPGSATSSKLPCVLVAPAGTRLVHGMGLAEGDRPEHTSYVRAGMVVVAYELDGPLPEDAGLTDPATIQAASQWMACEAGLRNAQDALSYVQAKIPEVDPFRIYTAGHSSAGTAALHLAQHEPRIKAVAAYAPCTDVEKRLGDHVVGPLDRRIKGFRGFIRASSPLRNAAQLRCPLFLFHAEDDDNVPISESEAFAAEVRKTNPNVTFQRARSGGHYNSMKEEGMAHAISWMMQLPNVQNWQPAPIGLRARNTVPGLFFDSGIQGFEPKS